MGTTADPHTHSASPLLDCSSAAFDFTTKGILQEAAKHTQYWRLKDSQGKAPGLLAWKPSRAVTFIDNHDTGSTQNHWPFPKDKVALGYAYIITHPGGEEGDHFPGGGGGLMGAQGGCRHPLCPS